MHQLLKSPTHAGISIYPCCRCAAFNPSAQTMILFGRRNGTGGEDEGVRPLQPTTGPLNDTWSWDGTDWTQIFPATSPSPRHAVAMSTFAKGILLMGGNVNPRTDRCDSSPHLCGSGETWFFVSNGPGTGNWQQIMAPGPSPRVLAGMADLSPAASPGPLPVGNFSPVLFGGWLNRDPATGLGNHGRSAETWLPNAAGPGPNFWTLSAPHNGFTLQNTGIGPPARCVVVFATTTLPKPGILLFSGTAEGDEDQPNTCLYQAGGGGSWTQIQDRNGPGTFPPSQHCNNAASAQDPTTGTPVLFTSNAGGQTWRFGP